MAGVERLIDASVAAEAYIIPEVTEDSLIDLSRVDFDALRAQFQRSHKRIEIERLKGSLNAKLQQMVRQNKTRVDYLERLQTLVDEYNAGAGSDALLDVVFERLVQFTQDLNAEEQRTVAEGLSEEELAVFDLLTRPGPKLSPEERDQVKAVARELLDILKREKLVLDWRKRQQSRAQVRHSIEEILDKLPAQYDERVFDQKCARVYEHIYEAYSGAGRSIYTSAA